MRLNESTLFRALVIIVGLAIVFVGINAGFGGIRTLGWQVSPDFFSVTNETNFSIQDSHARFLGGLFGTLGLFMVFATLRLQDFHRELRVVFVLTFFGGLARFTAPDLQVLLNSGVAVSLAIEIILMPILFFWLPRVLHKLQAQVA
jgi:hypothetical protein